MNPSRALYFCAAAFLMAAATTRAETDFKREILPLLEKHCVKCHSATHEVNGKTVKPKGGIRLDAAWALLKGSDDVIPVKPRDVANSDIVRVVTAPRDDDKAMPPEGKGDPLTPAEITTLKTWIAGGADFGGWEGNLGGRPAPTAVVVARAPAKNREHDLLYKKLSDGLKPPASEALQAARAAGAQIAPLSPDSPLLRVDFLTGVSRCDDAAVATLAPFADHIAHLDLARTSITDAAFKTIAQMPRLTRLDLRQTKVTDAGIKQLTPLKNLVSLNLYGAEVTDQSLGPLASLKTLKEICLTETRITEDGGQKLQTSLPEARLAFHLDLMVAPGTGRTKAKTK